MTINVANTGLTNTFDYWRNRTNELAYAMSQYVVTTDSNTATGNAAITGTFTADALVANTLTFSSTNGSINVNIITTSNISTNNLTVSTGSIANLSSNIFSSNTGNVVTLSSNIINSNTANLIVISSNNGTFASYVTVGNSTVNAVVNSTSIRVSNSTINITLTSPTLSQSSNGQYFFNANGTWTLVPINTSGSNTQVLFNDSNSYNGSAGFTFDKTSNTVTVANSIIIGTTLNQYITLTTTGTSTVALDQFATASYRSAEYIISIKDNTSNNYQLSKILLIHDGGTSYITEYGAIWTNTNIATFTSNIQSSNAVLYVTPTPTNTTIRIQKINIAV